MQTPDKQKAQDNEYLEAFKEDAKPAPEMSEDEAFGLNLPEDGTSDPSEGETTVVINAEAEADPAGMNAMPAGEEEPASEGDAPTDPKELQRQKSWEGRLKARERELEAREAALGGKGGATPAKPGAAPAGGNAAAADAMEGAADKLEAEGSTAEAQAVSEVVEKVESGEMTASQAMAVLAEDFGDEFVANVKALVKSLVKEVAGAEISKLDGTVNQMISEISDERMRAHFEAIADRHEDFQAIGDDRVQAYIEALPEEQRAAAEQAVSKGTTRQVIKFLDGLKAWEQSQGGADEEAGAVGEASDMGAAGKAMANAEGVRSGGLRLPETPERSDDYDAAWNQF